MVLAARGAARRATLEALARATSPDVGPAIERLLERGDAGTTIVALEALGRMGHVRVGRVAPHLLRGRSAVRAATARALGRSTQSDLARTVLETRLRHEREPFVRAALLVAAARHAVPGALDAAREQLDGARPRQHVQGRQKANEVAQCARENDAAAGLARFS